MIKPPLGVTPRSIWLQYRLTDLIEAIDRYDAAGLDPNKEWIEERNQLFFDLYGSNK
ncbi:hypothetical protein ACFP7A_00880 [Sporolactobacillus kofuensis]|uniref:Uncharacterized protein n=1 Tax=Sporolactobacillus kofuensis TaxID=269672 RepID=A0ABW1W9A7_9BACL|nr:hypothetical protein [Sporolactobacillus kofuensis]MCO7175543.1 hypothetical protein [Sporolactobacillus kofuensis]